MTRTIIVNDHELAAFEWREEHLSLPGEQAPPQHVRSREILEPGLSHLHPGEAGFRCDQPVAFDTIFPLKGDGRKFVVISNQEGRHVTKPY